MRAAISLGLQPDIVKSTAKKIGGGDIRLPDLVLFVHLLFAAMRKVSYLLFEVQIEPFEQP